MEMLLATVKAVGGAHHGSTVGVMGGGRHITISTCSTRAGSECVAQVLQGLCELNAHTTTMSIDGISADDSTSRAAFLGVLCTFVCGEALPFVRMFRGIPSYGQLLAGRGRSSVCALAGTSAVLARWWEDTGEDSGWSKIRSV